MKREVALERLVLRLSHMAEGIDSEADTILANVRKMLKGDASGDELEDASGRLARAILTNAGVDPDKSPTVEGGIDLSGMSKLIKTMPVRSEEHARMADLVKQIAKGTTSMVRQKALIELLGSATSALTEIAQRDKSEKGVRGWLNRSSSGSGDSDRYVTLFAALLQRLVEHIDVLNGNAVRSSSIKDSLEHLAHPDQAEHLLEEVTAEIESIDSRIRSERNQTTDFLGDLRQRLDSFESILTVLADDGDRSLKRSEDLQESVGEDARELGEAARVDDVQEMRALIDRGLTSITERLAEHVLAERQQNEVSREHVKLLTERLATLEDEADILRSEIRNKNDLALKDSLTGVYNRAGYDERTRELFARWERSGAALSMVFADCNKFKEINDNYGHGAGDLVLVKVADVLQTRARASDIVCRYGGDEFVVLLPDTHTQGAEIFARSACEEVAAAGFNDNGKPIDVAISCGVTELISGDSLETALARADEAMYQAKKMDGIKVCAIT